MQLHVQKSFTTTKTPPRALLTPGPKTTPTLPRRNYNAGR